MPDASCSNAFRAPAEHGVIADLSDFRPTIAEDLRPILHNFIHNDEAMLAGYLGFGCNVADMRTMILSGLVLKYVPAAYALLGVPDPAANTTNPPRDQVACTWALAFLFNEKTRAVLPDTLQKIQDKYNVVWCDLRTAEAQKEQLGDAKKRGQILAALLLAMHRDALAAEQMPPELFESTFMPYVMILEDHNPWDAPVYMLPMVPGNRIKWPNWGPISAGCHCEGHCEPMKEHQVEVYHRFLSLLRYALYQLEPRYYYKHLGKSLKNQADGQTALVAVARVKREQMQEVAELRKQQREKELKGKAKAVEKPQHGVCSALDELTHVLSNELFLTVPPQKLQEFHERAKMVQDMATDQVAAREWTDDEYRILSESFMWMLTNGAEAVNGPAHWTDEDRAIHKSLHKRFVFPDAHIRIQVHKDDGMPGGLASCITKITLAEAHIERTKEEKRKADARLQEAAVRVSKSSTAQQESKTQKTEHEKMLARMADLD